PHTPRRFRGTSPSRTHSTCSRWYHFFTAVSTRLPELRGLHEAHCTTATCNVVEELMKLREIRIKNFRCLVDVVVPIEDTTILVGENNSGKTALLNALRVALTRAMGGRGGQFDEYDYHMAKAGDSPETSDGIVVELWFRE